MNALNARWPWTMSRRELLDRVQAQLRAADIEAAADLEAKIDQCWSLIVLGLGAIPTGSLCRHPHRHAAEARRADEAHGGSGAR